MTNQPYTNISQKDALIWALSNVSPFAETCNSFHCRFCGADSVKLRSSLDKIVHDEKCSYANAVMASGGVIASKGTTA